jgi:hypothetical protein
VHHPCRQFTPPPLRRNAALGAAAAGAQQPAAGARAGAGGSVARLRAARSCDTTRAQLVRCTRLLRLPPRVTDTRTPRRCASAADNIAAGVAGAAQPLPPPPPQQRSSAASEIPVLAQFATVTWYECVVGVLYVILMSEARSACESGFSRVFCALL